MSAAISRLVFIVLLVTQCAACELSVPRDEPRVIYLQEVAIAGGETALPDPGIQLWDIARVTEDGKHLLCVGPSPTDDSLAEFVVWDLYDPQHPIVKTVTTPRSFARLALVENRGEFLYPWAWEAVVRGDGDVVVYTWSESIDNAISDAGETHVPAPFRSLNPRINAREYVAQSQFQEESRILTGASFSWFKRREHVSVDVPVLTVKDEADVQTENSSWISLETNLRGINGWTSGAAYVNSGLSLVVANMSVRKYRAEINPISPQRPQVVIWDMDRQRKAHVYKLPASGEQLRWVDKGIGFDPENEYWVAQASNHIYPRLGQSGIFLATLKAPWRCVFIDTPSVVQDVFWDTNGTMWLVLLRVPDQSTRPEDISQLQSPLQLVPIDMTKVWESE